MNNGNEMMLTLVLRLSIDSLLVLQLKSGVGDPKGAGEQYINDSGNRGND